MKLPMTPLEFSGWRPTGPYWNVRESRFRFAELRWEHHVFKEGCGAVRYLFNGVRITLESLWRGGLVNGELELRLRPRGLLKAPVLNASLSIQSASPEHREEGLPSLRGISVSPPFDLQLQLAMPLARNGGMLFTGTNGQANFSAAELRAGVARFPEVAVALHKRAGGPLTILLDSVARQGVKGNITIRHDAHGDGFALDGQLITLQPFITRYHKMIRGVPGLTEQTPVTLCVKGGSPTLRGLAGTVSMEVSLPRAAMADEGEGG